MRLYDATRAANKAQAFVAGRFKFHPSTCGRLGLDMGANRVFAGAVGQGAVRAHALGELIKPAVGPDFMAIKDVLARGGRHAPLVVHSRPIVKEPLR